MEAGRSYFFEEKTPEAKERRFFGPFFDAVTPE